jgi:uncharacterized membrane protein
VKTVRLRLGRGLSFIGMLAGLVMIVVGIESINTSGILGVFWTTIAGGFTIFSAFNAFSARAIATQEIGIIDIEDSSDSRIDHTDVADRFERLKRLRMDGLITEEEYQQKRGDIVNKL